jgi:hypothetical protein
MSISAIGMPASASSSAVGMDVSCLFWYSFSTSRYSCEGFDVTGSERFNKSHTHSLATSLTISLPSIAVRRAGHDSQASVLCWVSRGAIVEPQDAWVMTHQHLCCAGCTCWIPVKPEELVKSFLENVISVLYPGLVDESGSANVARPHALLDVLFRLQGTMHLQNCSCDGV